MAVSYNKLWKLMIDKKINMLYNINVLVIWGVVLIMEIKNVLLMVLVTFVFVALFIPVVKGCSLWDKHPDLKSKLITSKK